MIRKYQQVLTAGTSMQSHFCRYWTTVTSLLCRRKPFLLPFIYGMVQPVRFKLHTKLIKLLHGLYREKSKMCLKVDLLSLVKEKPKHFGLKILVENQMSMQMDRRQIGGSLLLCCVLFTSFKVLMAFSYSSRFI